MGVHAWVTTALDENEAEKATVLAASLRAVYTSGKLAVLASSTLPENLRGKLHMMFDLVSYLDENHLKNEHYAKMFAFSLTVFHGCVYLPSNSLVLKKCDEIFAFCSSPNFFVGIFSAENLPIFLFKPCNEHFQNLKAILETNANGYGQFIQKIEMYAQNNGLQVAKLENKFFQRLAIEEGVLLDGYAKDLSVINFGKTEPKHINLTNCGMGLLEKFAVERWRKFYRSLYSIDTLVQGKSNVRKPDNEPIAIIGMSCRYPGANTLEEFWNLLREGREGIKELPKHRWSKGETIKMASSKTRKVNAGFLDFPIGDFDAKFFGISLKEAELLDPQQRILYELTWEALEDASIDAHGLRGTHTGIFVGSWLHDYKDIAVKSADRDFFRIYMGNSLAATTARLSHFYKVTGPSIALESGCSSGIAAVHMACKSLRNGETNLAFAAGVNLLLHPFDHETISFVLAPNGRCKTFDANADGFGRAEGAGVLVLKRMCDAIADGDKIWGLVRGTGISQEGVSKSLGTPTIHCESLAMEIALKDASVHPKQVSFVEAHGTGTSVGDPMEIAAITKVYSDKERAEPLWIGSVKTNVGHTESVSGITGIIKVILSMENELIPPHLNFTCLNPEINLDAIPAQIPLEPVEWKKSTTAPRIAGVSSFGISGTDGHAIIEEAPDSSLTEFQPHLEFYRPLHILKISARSNKALDSLLERYEKLFESSSNESDGADFADVAFTANVGRATHSHRAIIVAKDNIGALKILRESSYKRKDAGGGGQAHICFLFTGQGSQYPGMARELYETNPVFRMAFDKCHNLLHLLYKIDIRRVMWGNLGRVQDKEMLNKTLFSQISIFVVEYSLMRMWMSWGIKPDYVLGHSLGEFAAVVCANILDLESALKMVATRSLLINALPEGKMLVVRADWVRTEELLNSFQEELQNGHELLIDLAALNSPDQTVLAGEPAQISEFAEFCSSREVKNVILAANHAFHSRNMNHILGEYERTLQNVFRDLKSTPSYSCKYISGMSGRLVTELAEILCPEYWLKHARERVSFIQASKTALDSCNVFLEIGPTPVLSTFVVANGSDIPKAEFTCLPSLRKNRDDWTTILESLSKLFLSDYSNVTIDWAGFDQYYKRSKVALPFYPFFRKKIWVDFRPTPGDIHPLVGKPISNASKSTIFESEFTLKQVRYLRDHTIGKTVLFPGAALLEMCVIAGHTAIQGLTSTGEFCRPRRPITLKGFRIETPLALQEGKACIMQTVVDLVENEEECTGYSIKVHNLHHDKSEDRDGDDDSQWRLHASGHFFSFVSDGDSNKLPPKDVCIADMQKNWEKVSATKDLYEKMAEVGFSFGPAFQSLTCGWTQSYSGKNHFGVGDPEPGNDVLFEVKLPTDTNYESYLVHPVILDAMIQASLLWTKKEDLRKKLYVPVHIEEFRWLSDGTGESARFIFCDRKQLTTFLLDGKGTILASMSGVECIETNVKLVESVVQQQSTAMPQLWEEIWKPKDGPLNGAIVSVQVDCIEDASINEDAIQHCKILNKMVESEVQVYHHLDRLTVMYFVNALYKLGWEPRQGEKITLERFISQFGIIGVARHFLRYFFNECNGRALQVRAYKFFSFALHALMLLLCVR